MNANAFADERLNLIINDARWVGGHKVSAVASPVKQ